MKIVIPGGTGQIGTLLVRAFSADGHDVVILSRGAKRCSCRVVHWDAKNVADWSREIDGADVVINLAGRSVDCRYTKRNRQLIMDSRVDSTRAIGQAIAAAEHPPAVWLQASTATVYSHRFDAANDETTGIIGGAEEDAPDTWQFSINVAKSWEAAANEADTPKTRKVLLRSAVTMSPDRGGVFDVLLRLVRFGLGGTCGNGRQYVSWIHEADFVRAIYWLIEHDDISGPVNVSSPQPIPNADFMCGLRNAWGAKIGLPATDWMLEVGTFLLRTETELVLKSRRVVPQRMSDAGFEFRFADWDTAAADLCARWRKQSDHGAEISPAHRIDIPPASSTERCTS